MSGSRIFRFGTTMLALTVGVIGSGAAAAKAAESAAEPSCSSSFDPYSVPLFVLQGCGFKIFPQQDSVSTVDGGMQYTYIVDGVKTVYSVPPVTWNLAEASDSQLAAYSLPARPEDPAALNEWSSMMMQWHSVTPPPYLVEGFGQATPSCGGCWSGYVAKSNNASAYNWGEIVYNEPSIGSTTCTNNSAITWVGIGGWGTTNLAQDGTAINWPGYGQHQGWFEIQPNYAVAEPIFGHPGYAFTAQLNRPGPNVWNFNMWDSYTGSGIGFQASGGYDGSSVEFIVERPWDSGTGWRWLTKYWYINVLDAYVNGYNPVGNYSPMNVSMYNGSHLLASNGALTNGGKSFQNNWSACS